jgi:signal transduction histidine kinase
MKSVASSPVARSINAAPGRKQGRLGLLWPDASIPSLILPLVIAAAQLIGSTFAAENQPEREPLDALGYVLLAAGPAALIWRERYPVTVLWSVIAVTLIYLLIGYPFGPFVLSVILALYTAVVGGHRLAAWLAGAALYGGHFALDFILNGSQPSLGQAGGVAAWLLVVLAASEVARYRRESVIEARQIREEESRRRASEERLGIARELHDVLAHNISLINVQSGVALHLMDRQPQQARTALTAIEAASRDALVELRSVLDILRQPEEGAPRSPAPGLARLDSLATQARAAGLEVETRVESDIRQLPAPVDGAVYRVVQEALTNVIRHAGASKATVRIRDADGELNVEIEDDGRGTGPSGQAESGSSGIAGMRERVAALGGHLEAGPLPGRGFRVHAQLPVLSSDEGPVLSGDEGPVLSPDEGSRRNAAEPPTARRGEGPRESGS